MSTTREKIDEVTKKIKREADAAPANCMPRRHLLGPTGALNTAIPCAACKLLRRRCAQECPFAPYFSPHEPQKFAAVHKVFGASNVSKILMEVPANQRADAANSLVYEANIRLRDPVYGCMGAILALQQQVQALEGELAAVKAEIVKCKLRQATAAFQLPLTSFHSGASNLLASSRGVSVAAPPPMSNADIIPAPSARPASSSSSMYTAASNSTDYSSITNENVPYYG